MLREKKTSRKTITVHGMSILIDGYLAYMVDCSKPVVAIRCEGWKHGFKGGLDMRRIDVVAEMNTLPYSITIAITLSSWITTQFRLQRKVISLM